MRLKLIAILFFGICSHTLFAQDFPYHYFAHFSESVYNPSQTARTSDINVALASFNLWAAGYQPVNDYLFGFSINPGFNRYNRATNSKVGVGAFLLRDQVGAFTKNSVLLNYAYHIPLNRTTDLSLGVCGISEFLSLGTSNLQAAQLNDPRILVGDNSTFVFDGGFGATVSSENYEIGLSVLNLAPSDFKFKNSAFYAINNYRKLFFSFKYFWNIDTDFVLQPFLLIRNNQQNQIKFDSLLDVKIKNISLGMGYRSEAVLMAYLKFLFGNFQFSYTSENPLKAHHMFGAGHTFSVAYQYSKYK